MIYDFEVKTHRVTSGTSEWHFSPHCDNSFIAHVRIQELKRSKKEIGGKPEIDPPRSSLFHSLQSLICLRSTPRAPDYNNNNNIIIILYSFWSVYRRTGDTRGYPYRGYPLLNQCNSNQLNTNQIKSNVSFWGEGKTGVPGEKPLGAE